MKRLPTYLLSLVAMSLLAACGGESAGGNLFDLDFETKDGKAAVALDPSEITGFYESKSREDYHSRIKLEEDKITFAGRCNSKELVAQGEGDIVLNRDDQTIEIVEEIEEVSRSDDYQCWFTLPEGERAYEMTDEGLVISGLSRAFGVFTKIGELDNK